MDSPRTASNDKHAAAVTRACELLAQPASAPALEELARAVGMSPFHFHRVFKAATGLTPRGYAAARRAERVRGELTSKKSVTDALYDAGFNSNGRFYAQASSMLGMAPRVFRNGGAGETIRYAVSPCALGFVLVAATERGVCTVMLGDDARPLSA